MQNRPCIKQVRYVRFRYYYMSILDELSSIRCHAVFGDKEPSEDNFVFISTQNVVWAGITMIQAELDLLAAAFQTGRWYPLHHPGSTFNNVTLRVGGIRRYYGVEDATRRKQRLRSKNNCWNGKEKIYSKCGAEEVLMITRKTIERSMFAYHSPIKCYLRYFSGCASI